MSLKKDIKLRLKKNEFVLYLWNKKRIKRDKKWLEKEPDDVAFVKKQYEQATGHALDLESPKRYTEKMNWLKVFYRDPKMVVCADKYEVREYLTQLGYGYLLNGLVGVWERAEDINVDLLPEKCVLKATNSSGANLIVRNKNEVNWKMQKKIMGCWLKQNIYAEGREWVYNEMKPRIVCEKFIESGTDELLDYKFACSNGKIDFIFVVADRGKGNISYTFYDTDWNRLPFRRNNYALKDAARPECLDEMIKLAKELSAPFPMVRVDFYNCGKKIYFGEFTFFDAGGYMLFNPDEFDFKYGEGVRLPEKNEKNI